jgi:hypothetical protein
MCLHYSRIVPGSWWSLNRDVSFVKTNLLRIFISFLTGPGNGATSKRQVTKRNIGDVSGLAIRNQLFAGLGSTVRCGLGVGGGFSFSLQHFLYM